MDFLKSFTCNFLTAGGSVSCIVTKARKMYMKINTNSFENDVLQSDLPVLVDFYATWCGPCKMLGPVLDQVAINYEGRAKVLKVDIDEDPELAQRFGITAVPTLILFHRGQPVQKVMGMQSPRQLSSLLDAVASPVSV
jgi:thioredoxin 1